MLKWTHSWTRVRGGRGSKTSLKNDDRHDVDDDVDNFRSMFDIVGLLTTL
jgi:hypothetical protein